MSRVAVQESIIAAMNTSLADAVVEVIFEDNSDYNPSTGKVDSGTLSGNRGIRYDFEQKEVDDESLVQSEIRLIIVQSEYAVIPQMDWFCTIGTDRYQVVGFIEDPLQATAEYQLRLK